MRKATLLIAIIILCLLAKAGFSQKKDSAAYDTVYVFRTADVSALKAIIMQSKIITDDGQPFTGNQLMQLMNWMDSRKTLIPKQQPKK